MGGVLIIRLFFYYLSPFANSALPRSGWIDSRIFPRGVEKIPGTALSGILSFFLGGWRVFLFCYSWVQGPPVAEIIECWGMFTKKKVETERLLDGREILVNHPAGNLLLF